MYDIVGDIHGHADELVQLLETLDYQKVQGVYGHPERKVIFLAAIPPAFVELGRRGARTHEFMDAWQLLKLRQAG